MAKAGETIELASWRVAWGMASIQFESIFIQRFVLHVPIYAMGFYSFTVKSTHHVIFLKAA